MLQRVLYILALALAILFVNSSGSLKAQDRKFIHYTNSDGLPYSAITDFEQDSQGFMWVAMRNSICRFDGYEFVEYETFDTAGVKVQLRVPKLVSNSNGEIYVTTNDSRLFHYRKENDTFEEKILPTVCKGYSDLSMLDNGEFLLLSGGVPLILSSELDRSEELSQVYPSEIIGNTRFVMLAEGQGNIVMLSEDGSIVSIDRVTRKLMVHEFHYSHIDNIHLFTIDSRNNIWISDAEIGLTRISLENGSRVHFCETCQDSRRIPHNMVRAVVYDNDGNIWMGTENGLAIWSPVYERMTYYYYDPTNPDGLNSNAIYDIYPDKLGNIWVGTYFGGINIWYSGEEFFSIRTAGFGPYDLGGKEVSCIAEDSNGAIWVGLEGNGVNKIDPISGLVTRFVNEPGRNSLSYNNVHPIQEGPDRKIYIGTYTGGLNIYDPVTGVFEFINMENSPLLRSDNIYSLFFLGDSLIVGTDLGVILINTRDGSQYSFHSEILGEKSVESICGWGDKVLISSGDHVYVWDPFSDEINRFDLIEESLSIIFVTTDSYGNIWVGDRYNGLYLYDTKRERVQNYSSVNGFPDSMIFGIVEEEDGWYWVSSSKGLIRFNPERNTTIKYTIDSGLPFNQFSFNAFYKDRKGTIYFGGINGLISFRSGHSFEPVHGNEIVFSRLEVFNRNLKPGDKAGYKTSINLGRDLTLNYNEKYFSIYFSALNFTHPGRIQYSYFLEGFDGEWIYSGNRNYATFTNLSPGNYRLHVRSYIDNLEWSDQETILNIRVKPPFMLSRFAYVVYTLLLITGLLLFYFVSDKIQKTKAAAIIERNEKISEQVLNQSKLEFFTNVSHELKTPLTLIIGPLTNLVRSGDVTPAVRSGLKQINDNARRLLALINQLMEFRKTDLGKATLRVSEGDINLFSREIKEAFDSIADIKSIDFNLENSTPFIPLWFDHEKLERILFNLLSNAFKYTEPGGRIIFRIKYSETFGVKINGGTLVFEVEDNGKGIDQKDIEKVFDRFYKTDDTRHNKAGSGIGLALVKNLLTLHGGDIEVLSSPGKGSLFRFWIPCSRENYQNDELLIGDLEYRVNTEELIDLEISQIDHLYSSEDDKGKSTVLIVDDNLELLSFLSESVSERFNVHTATNGEEALAAIESCIPDIIVSDIIMPVMDGYELTRKIKSSLVTSHIPVILLSAKTEVEDKYEGLVCGADSFIEKPFYPHLLLKHIENIVSTRERIISKFRNNYRSNPAEIANSQSDKEFIERLTGIINKNIDNPELDVTLIVREMSVSRSLLHLKLKKIANCSATGFIRSLRLRKAAALILDEEVSFSEAAYRTGFSSPAFFSRRFKEYFGKTPSQFLDDSKSA